MSLPLLRSLYGRIALALLGLLVFVGVVQVAITVVSTHRYEQEVTQRLNLDLARNLVEQDVLLVDGEIDETALEGVFATLMVINPNIECYLVDTEGHIVTHSAPAGAVVRQQIDTRPIERMMQPEPELPVLGDDPMHPTRQKVFSFSPLMVEDSYWGYLYVVLASQHRESVAALLQGNHILRLSLGLGGGAIAVALMVGLVLFNWLTRPLRRLTAAVESSQASDFSEPPFTLTTAPQPDTADEIGTLSAAFAQMARRIAEQVRRLQQTDQLRRELIANVSHDLRTPLATLKGYLETLELKEDELVPEQRRDYLAVASRQGDRLSTLVDQLFELAQLESSEMQPDIEPFLLTELVQDVVQDFQLKAHEISVELRMESPHDAPLVAADIALIQRVLQNLDQQRPTPHRAGRLRDRVREGERRGRGGPHQRHRLRHSGGRAREDLRPLLSGRRQRCLASRRRRSRAGHRAPDPRAPRVGRSRRVGGRSRYRAVLQPPSRQASLKVHRCPATRDRGPCG